MNTDLHLKIDNHNLSQINSDLSLKKVSNKEGLNYLVSTRTSDQVSNVEIPKSGESYKIQLKDLLCKREVIEEVPKSAELASFAKNFGYLLQRKLAFEKEQCRKNQNFNFRLSRDIFVRDIEKVMRVVQMEGLVNDSRLENLKTLRNSVILELRKEGEEEGEEETGFCEDQVNEPCYVPSLGVLPIAGVFDETVNLEKIFQENDKKMKLGRNFLKSKKSIGESMPRGEKETQLGSKNKKTDFQIILTARISKFDPKDPAVLRENAHKCFLDIREHLPVHPDRKSSSLPMGQVTSSQLFKLKFAEIANNCIKIQRFFNKSENEQNFKKLAHVSSKVSKKDVVKVRKSGRDHVARSKKMFREVVNFWKKKSKELIELKKKKEKFEMELKKREEERREQEKQMKKIEYLMTQSVFYAQVMAKKMGIATDHKMSSNQVIALTEEERQAAEKSIHSMIKLDQERVGVSEEGDFDLSQVKLSEKSDLVRPADSFNGILKDYQLKGLKWLDNLYEQGINGILADEMGLGKTIQALALMSHISEHRDTWGPFLVIAPTTTLFNWHSELLKFCPNLKPLPFWGSLKQRKELRRYLQQKHLGEKHSSFHVVITSYQIAVLEEKFLQRINWGYIVLDEAQAIKNINSQRWNILLGFKSRNKLLLTGTPIQNTMAELWALLHFIMPKLFDSHEQFQEWFSKDIEANSQDSSKLNQNQLDRLHAILKPFMLRRVKKDVEKEMGQKHEFEIYCPLSLRQKELYSRIKSRISLNDLFTSKESEERNKNLMNIVMQLRKVCNHPNLFEKSVVKSPLFMNKSLSEGLSKHIFENRIDFLSFDDNSSEFSHVGCRELSGFREEMLSKTNFHFLLDSSYMSYAAKVGVSRPEIEFICDPSVTTLKALVSAIHYVKRISRSASGTSLKIQDLQKEYFCTKSLTHIYHKNGHLDREDLKIFVPRVVAPSFRQNVLPTSNKDCQDILKSLEVKLPRLVFTNVESLIVDSSKLKFLDGLLRKLHAEKKRVLIFCQMTKMMDILQNFLEYRKYRHFRLDGSCNISVRRDMVKEFQANSDIFVFLLSTRAGGLGVTLTAADVVVFFDNDWNPTMDAQAADRAHRIGRTKDVDVYVLVSKNTIEERIVRRAKEKKNVQQTVYSGEAFKGNVFRAHDVMSLLFEETEIKAVVTRTRKEVETEQQVPVTGETLVSLTH